MFLEIPCSKQNPVDVPSSGAAMCLSQDLLKSHAHHSSRPDGSIKKAVSESSNLGHRLPCEEGAKSMLDVENAMKLDAASQVDMLDLLGDRLDGIVRINDQRKVNSRDMHG